MFGLRSRREDSGGSSGHMVLDQGFGSEGPGKKKAKATVRANPVQLGLMACAAFVAFIVFLKATAPPVHKRYQGMKAVQGQRKNMFNDGPAKQAQKVSRKGQVLHKPITSIKMDDLKGLGGELPENIEAITYEEAIHGRERLVEILNDAGVEELDVPTILSLPTWESVTKLYGDGPVVIGLETCQQFRDTIPLDDASIGTAGMFNTGTNPFAMYIESNCIMPHNTHDSHGGTRWQVPWGKHTLASRKWTHTARRDTRVNKTNVLPVAIVRDPYSWMQSMCKHPYDARWPHSEKHCPNLVPNSVDFSLPNASFPGNTVPVRVRYDPPATFDSLAHYWTTWYKEYLEADYPRLIVRFEDLQFHAKEMINLVCECAGAVPRDPDAKFTYVVDSGKWGNGHRGVQTNLITAMIKYGTDAHRFNSMTQEDLELAAEELDPALMELFHYEIPSL